MLDSGRYLVLDTRETTSRRVADGGNESFYTITGTRSLDSTVLNADGSAYTPDGEADAVDVFSRVLTRSGVTDQTHYTEFVPVRVVRRDSGTATVLGLYDDTATRSQTSPSRLLGITVSAASRSTPMNLSLPSKAHVVSVVDGGPAYDRTYVTTTAGTTEFDVDFNPDPDWGTGGTTSGSYTASFPDDAGRLLFVDPDGFGRLDGE